MTPRPAGGRDRARGLGQGSVTYLVLGILFIVLGHVVVGRGHAAGPALAPHDGQVGVVVADREQLRGARRAGAVSLACKTSTVGGQGRHLCLECGLHLGELRVLV